MRYAFEFETQAELDAYLKAHPNADPSNHWVNDDNDRAPSADEAESQIRAMVLSDTSRKSMFSRAADALRSTSGKLVRAVVDTAKDEVETFRTAGQTLVGLTRGEPVTREGAFAMASAAVTVTGLLVAASTGGLGAVAGFGAAKAKNMGIRAVASAASQTETGQVVIRYLQDRVSDTINTKAAKGFEGQDFLSDLFEVAGELRGLTAAEKDQYDEIMTKYVAALSKELAKIMDEDLPPSLLKRLGGDEPMPRAKVGGSSVMKPEYVAVILDDGSELLRWWTSEIGPTLPKQFAHHMTIKFKPSPEDLEGIELGAPASLKVVGWADNGSVQAVVVSPVGATSTRAIPHITVATDGVAKPADSNALLQQGYVPVAGGPVLKGRVGAVVGGKDVFSAGLSKSACIIAVGEWDGKKTLFKNRDRNYKPEIKVYHEVRDGVEILYMKDEVTGWVEGLNQYGIGVVNTALAVRADEKQGEAGKGSSKVGATGSPSFDGQRVLATLVHDNLEDAVEEIKTNKGGLRGHTFVSDKDTTYALESQWGGKIQLVKKLPAGKKHVRTNHGIMHPDAGYTEKDGDNYLSSLARRDQATKVVRSVEAPEEVAPSIYGKRREDLKDPLNMVKLTDNMRTTSQMMLNLTDLTLTLYLIPEQVKFLGYEDKLPKGHKPKLQLFVKEYTDIDKDGNFEIVDVKMKDGKPAPAKKASELIRKWGATIAPRR